MAPGVLHRVIHGTPHPEAWHASYSQSDLALLQSYRRHRDGRRTTQLILRTRGRRYGARW